MGRKRLYKTNADRQRAFRKRLKRSVHFKSETLLWETPQDYFEEYARCLRYLSQCQMLSSSILRRKMA